MAHSVSVIHWILIKTRNCRRPPLQHSEPDRQSLGSTDKDRCRAAGHPGKFDPHKPGEQLFKENPHFQARKVLAKTGVCTVAEGQAATLVGIDAKTFRLLERLFVAVA